MQLNFGFFESAAEFWYNDEKRKGKT